MMLGCAVCSADVTEHGCLTTVAATPSTARGAGPDVDFGDDLDGHMVSSVSELDEGAAARAVKLLQTQQNGV